MIKIHEHKSSIGLIVALVLCITPLIYKPIDANAAAKAPVITSPTNYEELVFNEVITVKWTHSGDTPIRYSMDVRALSLGNTKNYNTLVVEDRTTTSLQTKIKISELDPCSVYRVCVAAEYANTTKYSTPIVFFTSTHNLNIPRPISFKIWTGFDTATKNAIYYATQTWNNQLGFEAVNTYPFDNGYPYAIQPDQDGINAVTGAYVGIGEYLMTATPWPDRTDPTEYDICINKDYPWANSAQSGKYDVQSSIMHELGHVLGLSHKYEDFAVDWTMYGEGSKNSIKRRSLELEDINCLNDLY